MPRKSDNPRLVSFTRLPNGIQQTGIARIELQQKHGIVTDLVQIPEGAWSTARWRVHGTGVECQSLPTTRTIFTDNTMSARVILRKILLRHSNLRTKHKSCIKPIVDRVRRGG
jgi:hypothetical protein